MNTGTGTSQILDNLSFYESFINFHISKIFSFLFLEIFSHILVWKEYNLKQECKTLRFLFYQKQLQDR